MLRASCGRATGGAAKYRVFLINNYKVTRFFHGEEAQRYLEFTIASATTALPTSAMTLPSCSVVTM